MKKIILFLLLAIYFIKGQSQHISVNQIVNEVVYLCDNYPYGKIPTPNDTTKVFLLALDKVEDTLIMGVSRVKTDTQFYRTSPTYFLMTSNMTLLFRFSDSSIIFSISEFRILRKIDDQNIDLILNRLFRLNGRIMESADINMITKFNAKGELINHTIYEDSYLFPWKYYKVHRIAFKDD